MKRLIIGLGNPEEKHAHNRHNAGFIVLDEMLGEGWKEKTKLRSVVLELKDENFHSIYIKPQTYMNLSGQAVQMVKEFHKIDNKNITVVHDEVDLNFGTVKKKLGGGSAGHKGVESIIRHIGEDFSRIRIGIRNEITELVQTDKFVLSNFSKEEYEALKTKIASEVRQVLSSG